MTIKRMVTDVVRQLAIGDMQIKSVTTYENEGDGYADLTNGRYKIAVTVTRIDPVPTDVTSP